MDYIQKKKTKKVMEKSKDEKIKSFKEKFQWKEKGCPQKARDKHQSYIKVE